MISISGAYRPEFHNKIKSFCQQNNMIIQYIGDVGNYLTYTIAMDVNETNEFFNYLNQLEGERTKLRKTKTLWWRIRN